MLENFKFTKPSQRNDYDLIKLTYKQLTNLLHFFSALLTLEGTYKTGEFWTPVKLKKSETEFNKKDSEDVFGFCTEIFKQIDYSKLSKLDFNIGNKIEERLHKESMYKEYSELKKFFESNLNEERSKNSYNEKLIHLHGRLDHTYSNDGTVYGFAQRFSTILINFPRDVEKMREYKEYDEIEDILQRGYNFTDFESVFSDLLSKNSFRWIKENIANKNDIKKESENFKIEWEEATKTAFKINEIYEPFSRKLDFKKPKQSLEDLKMIEIKIKDLENDDKDYDTNKIQEALKHIESLKESLETISKTKITQTNLELLPYAIFVFLFVLFLLSFI